MPSLLTAAGTLVFYAPAQRELRHGEFPAAPRNLSITRTGDTLCLGWLTGQGGVGSEEFILEQQEGKRSYALRRGTEFLNSQPDGTLQPGPGKQFFLLLDERAHEDLAYLLAHQWSLLSPIASEKLPAPAHLAENFTLQLCNKNLPLDDPGIPFPAITQASRAAPGEVIFQYEHFLAGRARLYNPLIYFCVFGDARFVLMLTLFLRTLEENSDYQGKILILTDRPEAELRPIVPQKFQSRTSFVQRNLTTIPEFAAARYDISTLNLQGFQPILYCDVDMICTAPITPMLLDILHSDALCFSAEHTDLPNLWTEHADFTNWFGRPLFDADSSWTGPAKNQNSGIFGFTHIARTEIAFRFIRSVMQQFKQHSSIKMFSQDQAYTSYTLQKLQLSQPEFLNRHVQVLSDKLPDPAGPTLPLVHFNYGLGNTIKFDAMAKFYAGILALPKAK